MSPLHAHNSIQSRSLVVDGERSDRKKDAIDTMKAAGVDMTKPDYLEAAFSLFEQRLAELEEILQKG